MKFIRKSFPLAMPYFLAIFAVFFSVSAMAQYVWLDAAGRKVFSDQPPPPNIAAKRILQQPGKATLPMPAAPTDEASATDGEGKPKAAEAVAKTAPSPKIVSKDKDLEAAKKKADDEAAAKKKAEDDARNVARADNCVRAKQAKTTLDSGVRLNQINAKGERVFMDDAARMVETKRLEGIMAADCK
jgi:type IV secretory pathway VirB10-like protein